PRRRARLVQYLRSRPPGIDWYSKPILCFVARWWGGRNPRPAAAPVIAGVSAEKGGVGETPDGGERDIAAVGRKHASKAAQSMGISAETANGAQRNESLVDLIFRIGKRAAGTLRRLLTILFRRGRTLQRRVAS